MWGWGFQSTLKYRYEVLLTPPNSLAIPMTYLCLEAFVKEQHFLEVAKAPDVESGKAPGICSREKWKF